MWPRRAGHKGANEVGAIAPRGERKGWEASPMNTEEISSFGPASAASQAF